MQWMRSAGMRSISAIALRSGKTPCEWVQTVSALLSNSATAQDGPIEACIW
jgi:hypothetical protein